MHQENWCLWLRRGSFIATVRDPVHLQDVAIGCDHLMDFHWVAGCKDIVVLE